MDNFERNVRSLSWQRGGTPEASFLLKELSVSHLELSLSQLFHCGKLSD